MVLVVVVVRGEGGQIYFKCLLCVSSHSNDFIVLAKKKIINCQNRTDRQYDGPVLRKAIHMAAIFRVKAS